PRAPRAALAAYPTPFRAGLLVDRGSVRDGRRRLHGGLHAGWPVVDELLVHLRQLRQADGEPGGVDGDVGRRAQDLRGAEPGDDRDGMRARRTGRDVWLAY